MNGIQQQSLFETTYICIICILYLDWISFAYSANINKFIKYWIESAFEDKNAKWSDKWAHNR
jgi:hypothetical protein